MGSVGKGINWRSVVYGRLVNTKEPSGITDMDFIIWGNEKSRKRKYCRDYDLNYQGVENQTLSKYILTGGGQDPPMNHHFTTKKQLKSPFHHHKTAQITITRIFLISPITKQETSNHHKKIPFKIKFYQPNQPLKMLSTSHLQKMVKFD